MTDIVEDALALLNKVQEERQHTGSPWNSPTILTEALYRAIEQHEAFRQEVSDALREWGVVEDGMQLSRFIIAEPDPLVDVWLEAFPGNHVDDARDECAKISEALAKRGGKIVWENEQ
jgi:hypothetical protein